MPRILLALIVAASGPALVACASTAAVPRSANMADEGEPTPIGTPTSDPATATPTPPEESPCAKQNDPPPAELQPYLSRIPKFDKAPVPQPVALPHVEGQAAFAYEIPTSQKVAFLTIDDGAVKHPLALALMKASKIPVTLFLTTDFIADDKDFFKRLRDTGCATIQNHTLSHPELPKYGYDVAKQQLCGASNNLANWYGKRPNLFRPPFGSYDSWTLKAAWDCGLQAGFYWRETVDAGNVYYQRDSGHIHAGDIILMHFRPAFPDDFLAALNAIKNSGLTPALLDDYVRIGAVTAGAPGGGGGGGGGGGSTSAGGGTSTNPSNSPSPSPSTEPSTTPPTSDSPSPSPVPTTDPPTTDPPTSDPPTATPS